MILTKSILDEASSTDDSDSHSEIVVLRPGDDSHSISDDDDDWGVVSMDGSEPSGELILEGEETAEDPELIYEDDEKAGSQLSLPGADSIPTVVGSIDGLPLEDIAEREPLEETPTASSIGEEKPTALEAGVQTLPEQVKQPTAPKSRLLFLLVPALLLMPTIVSICLYNERNTLQMSVMELEDAVSSLHLEAEQRKLEEELLWEDKEFLQLSSRELQEKVFSLKRETETKKKKEQLQLETLQKERSTLKLYVLHLQDSVASLKKKAAKDKREGDILFQDKKFLEWSALSLQEKVKALKREAKMKKTEEEFRLLSLTKEKSSLHGVVAKAQDEIARIKKEADRKLREEELRWNSLFQEKISLRVSTAKLEEQVFKLQKKAKRGRREGEIIRWSLQRERDALLLTVVNLEEEVSALKKEAGKRTQDLFNLNACGAQSGDTVLADNCWLNAKANIHLGGCANDARHAVKGALYNISESVSHWMETYSAAAEAYAASVKEWSSTNHTTDAYAEQMKRKVDYLGQKLMNATSTKSTTLNTTSTKTASGAHNVTESVAKMMRKVDSFGRALWNATAFQIHRGVNATSRNQGRSFFSRMDLNGKLWFESFFPSSSSRRVRRAAKNSPSALDKVFQKVSDIILLAGTPDQVLQQASAIFLSSSNNSSIGERDAFMARAMENLCTAMAFNQTSKKYLMTVAKNAFEEVSLTHASNTMQGST